MAVSRDSWAPGVDTIHARVTERIRQFNDYRRLRLLGSNGQQVKSRRLVLLRSRDGERERFLMLEGSQESEMTQIHVVLNWREELERLAALPWWKIERRRKIKIRGLSLFPTGFFFYCTGRVDGPGRPISFFVLHKKLISDVALFIQHTNTVSIIFK